MKRRNFVLYSALALSTSVTFSESRVPVALATDPSKRSKVILLIHGAWHSALHWRKVAELLTYMGHRVVAMDLPGHGLQAKFPTSYLRQDLAMLATEESPLKALTIKDYVDAVVEVVRTLSADRKVIVVGHSMGGIVLNQLGEKKCHIYSQFKLVFPNNWEWKVPLTEGNVLGQPDFSKNPLKVLSG